MVPSLPFSLFECFLLGSCFLADEHTHFYTVFFGDFIHAVGLFGMLRALTKNLILRFAPGNEITVHPDIPAG